MNTENPVWQLTKDRSNYHFDPKKQDSRWDRIWWLGKIVGSWEDELAIAIEKSKPVPWGTQSLEKFQSEEYEEELALKKSIGMWVKSPVTNLFFDLPSVFEKMSNLFGLENKMARVHVQWPGQVWPMHVDRLDSYNRSDINSVRRFTIQLHDWQPGHFWIYGNQHWTTWNSGDVATFDWQNVPHGTANCGIVPRATLQVTGIETEQTREFLKSLEKQDYYL